MHGIISAATNLVVFLSALGMIVMGAMLFIGTIQLRCDKVPGIMDICYLIVGRDEGTGPFSTDEAILTPSRACQ